MTYRNMGDSNYSRNIFSNRDQTFKNKAHTAKQLITLASKGSTTQTSGEETDGVIFVDG